MTNRCNVSEFSLFFFSEYANNADAKRQDASSKD